MKITRPQVWGHWINEKILVGSSKGCRVEFTPFFFLILLAVEKKRGREILQSHEALSRKLFGGCWLQPDQLIS